MQKNERFFEIRRIIDAHVVGNQEELRLLLSRKGIKVTQATLSRDLKDLGVFWHAGPDGGRYIMPDAAVPETLYPSVLGVQDIRANESLVVIITAPGSAGTVAAFIDARRNPDVLGTLAGDNTVLVIPVSVKRVAELKKKLEAVLIKDRK